MAQFDERALILDVASYKESSMLVRLLTEAEGRITLVARGARSAKNNSPAAALQPFAVVRLRFALKDGATMGTLISAELEKPAVAARESVAAYAVSSFWFEVLKETSQERVSMMEIFALTEDFLEAQISAPGLTTQFLLQLMALCQCLGFGITWDRCVECGRLRPENAAPQYFSIASGGIVCSACAEERRAAAIRLSAEEARAALELLRAHDAKVAEQPEDCARDRLALLGLLHRFLTYHIEHPLKSYAFVRDTAQ